MRTTIGRRSTSGSCTQARPATQDIFQLSADGTLSVAAEALALVDGDGRLHLMLPSTGRTITFDATSTLRAPSMRQAVPALPALRLALRSPGRTARLV